MGSNALLPLFLIGALLSMTGALYRLQALSPLVAPVILAISAALALVRAWQLYFQPRRQRTPEDIKASGMSEEATTMALGELAKVEGMSKNSPDYGKSTDYLEQLLALPWTAQTTDRVDLRQARSILDRDHFGMEKVKERIVEELTVRKRTGAMRGGVLCFAGPAGVGKTSIAKDIAEVMGRKFVEVALGGVSDETEIRGHRRTYLGSLPGSIMSAMKKAGTKNPVMLLDEMDKVGAASQKGDPAACLLELLDPEQNHAFRDHYFDVGFDMSQVLFIITANYLQKIPDPLRNRLEIVQFNGYTEREKFESCRRHLIPLAIAEHKLQDQKFELTDAAVRAMIDGYTTEAGVRQLGQIIRSLMRKLVVTMENGNRIPARIDVAEVAALLGVASLSVSRITDNSVGVASYLYYRQDTGAGGVGNAIVNVFPGRGEIILREQMGKMMLDSVKNVLGYVRARAAKLGIDPFLFGRVDVDVAFSPWENIDGPSAGITMSTALVSRLTGRSVKKGVAMTGEFSPDGRVLPIGGLKEKSLGAARNGYATVLYPVGNQAAVDVMPDEVKSKVKLLPIETIEQVLELALEKEITEPLPPMTPPQ